ncbi:hypothetical protein [Parafrankia elaeagni]|uniref:hypothetical protein n=1 Tax=Parafrankia elaeagni TaxID=222534 RepID=UPI0012B60178|nr:hypothetical protein [Parafrankia elaeagni]
MHAYEKEIAKREGLMPLCSYPYKVIPVSDQAKLFFALFNKKRGPIEKTTPQFIEKYLKTDKFPFTGKISFYYDNPNESERGNEVRSLVNWNMAENWVPGIQHPKSGKISTQRTLEEGKDYRIEIGEKIMNEQPKKLSFNDIKAL